MNEWRHNITAAFTHRIEFAAERHLLQLQEIVEVWRGWPVLLLITLQTNEASLNRMRWEANEVV